MKGRDATEINLFANTRLEIPNENETTLCELSGSLLTVTSPDDYSLTEYLAAEGEVFPNISVDQGHSKDEHQTAADIHTVIDATPVCVPKYFEINKNNVFLETGEQTSRQKISELLNEFWSSVTSATEWAEQCYSCLFGAKRNVEDFCDSIGPIRAISWHPVIPKICIATLDSVFIYDVLAAEWWPSPLTNIRIKNIRAVEWCKSGFHHIAVGCDAGVALWRIEGRPVPSTLHSGSPAPSSIPTVDSIAVHLSVFGTDFGSVTSVSWSTDSRHIAASSPLSTKLMVVDVKSEKEVYLRATFGVTSVHWSPDGQFVVTGHVLGGGGDEGTKHFSLWETSTWTSSSYRMNSMVQDIVWHPKSRGFAVSFVKDTNVYFFNVTEDLPQTVVKVASTISTASFIPRLGCSPVCGYPHQLAWDPTGTRFAVSFSSCTTIGLVRTEASSWTVDTEAIGLIRGPLGTTQPTKLLFVPNYKRGALLSTAWRSGRVSFVPMYF